jgi:tetratricopeptide (TPR) repeat protein
MRAPIFVGREDAINQFDQLFSYRRQRNTIYYQADGGLGKTRLLLKIEQESRNAPYRVVPLPIDFTDLANRTVEGLQASMAGRLGENFFTDHVSARRALSDATVKGDPESLRVALRQQVDEAFFQGFQRATRDRQVVLSFDTFEVAQNKYVGRWFIREFLPRASNAFIVIAGRPRKPDLQFPSKVVKGALPTFEDIDVKKYLQELRASGRGAADDYLSTLTDEDAENLRVKTGGSPLLIALIMHYGRSMRALLDDPKVTLETIRRDLISFLFDASSRLLSDDARDIILLISRAWRRFKFEMLTVDYVTSLEKSESDLRAELKAQPFIKYREEDDVFTLHDEFQEMIEQYGSSGIRFEGAGGGDAVDQWYQQQIEAAGLDKVEWRQVLQAERLGYRLDQLKTGDKRSRLLYEQFIAEAKAQKNIELIMLLWDELYDHRKYLDDQGLIYCSELANWLYDSGFFLEAENFYRLLIEEYAVSKVEYIKVRAREKYFDNLARLGHCQKRLGKMPTAQKTFEAGLAEAKAQGRIDAQGAFLWNIGQIFEQAGDWERAQQNYEAAIECMREVRNFERIAEIQLNVGRIWARMGDYASAVAEFENAQGIRPLEGEDVWNARVRMELGLVHRYQESTGESEDYYLSALNILAEENNLRANALQGLGVTYHQIGRKKRQLNPTKDADFQVRAFERLNEALRLCRERVLTDQLPSVLRRIGYVFREHGLLERDLEQMEIRGAKSEELRQQLALLDERLAGFLLPEEMKWRGYLAPPVLPFEELDALGKAQRLLEVSALEADSYDQYHFALEGLVDAADVARLRGPAHRRDVEWYVEDVLQSRRSRVYQQKMFNAMAEIISADVDFDAGRIKSALEVYAKNYPLAAEKGGYGAFLIRNRLEDLYDKLSRLDPSVIKESCNYLIAQWEMKPGFDSALKRLRGLIDKAAKEEGRGL